MNPQNNIRQNSLWLLFARGAAHGVGILFSAIIARRLSVDGFGEFSFIASLVFIGNTVTNFGTDTYLVRDVSRAGTVADLASRSFTLQFFLSILYIAAMLLFPRPGLFIYSLILFPLATISVNSALFRAFGRMDLLSYVSLLNGGIQITAALLSYDVYSLCLYFLVGQLIVAVASYIVCTGSIPTYTLFPLRDFRPVLKPILPFAVLTILLVFIQRLGLLTTSWLLGDSPAGFFASILRIVEGLKLGHYALLGALLPALSSAATDSWKSFRKAFMLLMSASFVFSIIVVISSKWIILILYGNEYLEVSSHLGMLVWSLLPYTVSSFIAYALIARGREPLVVKSTVIALGVYVVLYLWFIPSMGLIGTTYAALIGEFIQAIIFIWSYIRLSRNKSFERQNIGN